MSDFVIALFIVAMVLLVGLVSDMLLPNEDKDEGSNE